MLFRPFIHRPTWLLGRLLWTLAIVTSPTMALNADGREFALYFREDSSELTAEAQIIVADAAAFHASRPELDVLVWGHSDRVGSRRHNFRLSKRRARTVGRELVALQVPAKRITLKWSGETQLLHPTEDEVPEPYNRSVLIIIGEP